MTPVKIKSAAPNLTNKERIFRLIKKNDETSGAPDLSAADIRKVTGIRQNSVGSSLCTLEKEGKIHKIKKVGENFYTYHYGEKPEPTFSSELKALKEARRNYNEKFAELDRATNRVNAAINIAEKRMEHTEDEVSKLKERLQQMKKRAETAESEHEKLLGFLGKLHNGSVTPI